MLTTRAWLAGLLAIGSLLPWAQARGQEARPTAVEPARAAPAPSPRQSAKPVAATGPRVPRSQYIQRSWGVDIVGVRRVSSGSMLRFDYRVLDPGKAAALTDRKARPYLIDEATRTALAVPAMENIGELRQVAPLEAQRTYFVIFGNPGGLVKRGGRVTLVVGNFRAEGLVVD
jgi:hypothetical protein